MFSLTDNDTTIIYQGGSGGFFLYFLLLLQKHNPEVIWPLIYKQFSDKLKYNQRNWKETEIWPEHNNPYGVNLICNPLFCEEMYEKNKAIIDKTEVILLYTDLRTQLRLAYDKTAYWFTQVSKEQFNAPINNFSYLKLIKSNYSIFNNIKVDPIIPQLEVKFAPTQLILLQEIIKNKKLLNADQQKFVDYWLHLQTNKSKYLLK